MRSVGRPPRNAGILSHIPPREGTKILVWHAHACVGMVSPNLIGKTGEVVSRSLDTCFRSLFAGMTLGRECHERGVLHALSGEECLDKCHVTIYNRSMIKSFADRNTQELYETGRSRRVPPDIRRRAIRKPEYVNLATCIEDLRVPPGNRLHELERDRKGQFSISVNDQWRICFRFVGGDAYDVEFTDYH